MDDSRTVYCGNLSDKVTEELLYELFLQAAPLEQVRIPTDREGRRSNFGFVTFKHEISVPYAVKLLDRTRLFDKPINVKPRKAGGGGERPQAPPPMPLCAAPDIGELLMMGQQLHPAMMMMQPLMGAPLMAQPFDDGGGPHRRGYRDFGHRRRDDFDKPYHKQGGDQRNYRDNRRNYDNRRYNDRHNRRNRY